MGEHVRIEFNYGVFPIMCSHTAMPEPLKAGCLIRIAHSWLVVAARSSDPAAVGYDESAPSSAGILEFGSAHVGTDGRVSGGER
mmetsp:Transcript_17046/g.22929  ORF Transcript_17046/g.22929 Transcript_17046/m.22929 type:complete len:84 (+) Transcript_17046:307-558(+)